MARLDDYRLPGEPDDTAALQRALNDPNNSLDLSSTGILTSATVTAAVPKLVYGTRGSTVWRYRQAAGGNSKAAFVLAPGSAGSKFCGFTLDYDSQGATPYEAIILNQAPGQLIDDFKIDGNNSGSSWAIVSTSDDCRVLNGLVDRVPSGALLGSGCSRLVVDGVRATRMAPGTQAFIVNNKNVPVEYRGIEFRNCLADLSEHSPSDTGDGFWVQGMPGYPTEASYLNCETIGPRHTTSTLFNCFTAFDVDVTYDRCRATGLSTSFAIGCAGRKVDIIKPTCKGPGMYFVEANGAAQMVFDGFFADGENSTATGIVVDGPGDYLIMPGYMLNTISTCIATREEPLAPGTVVRVHGGVLKFVGSVAPTEHINSAVDLCNLDYAEVLGTHMETTSVGAYAARFRGVSSGKISDHSCVNTGRGVRIETNGRDVNHFFVGPGCYRGLAGVSGNQVEFITNGGAFGADVNWYDRPTP